LGLFDLKCVDGYALVNWTAEWLESNIFRVDFSGLGEFSGRFVFEYTDNLYLDYFNDVAMAKMGFGVMAVTGCFAGQLFNLLVGFGAFLLNYLSRHSFITIDLFDFDKIKDNYLTIVIIFVNLINLSQNMIYLMTHK